MAKRPLLYTRLGKRLFWEEGANTVNETNWGFDDANKNNVVIRRFVGEPKFYFITPYIPSTTPNIL